MPSPYTIKTVTNIAQAKLLEGEWRSLTEKNVGTKSDLQYFMSWEWLSQWLETYEDFIAELKIICILYNGEYIAIAPFYICINSPWNITTKTLSFIATNEPEQCEVASEFIDIAYSSAHKYKVIKLLSTQLTKLNNITHYSFKDLNKNALMYTVCQKIKHTMLAFEENVSGYQFIINTKSPSQYSSSFLKKKKRILNKFEKIGNSNNCQFVIASEISQALNLYEQLIKLHQQRWEQKNKPGVFSNSYFYEFHKSLIKRCFKKGMIILSAIQIENKTISVNYSIKWYNTLYFYQSGIDELYKPNITPGLVNHLLLISYCQKNNIKQYNLLKSSKVDDYKSQFSQPSDEAINITMLSFNKFNYLTYGIQFIKSTLKRIIKKVEHE